MKHLKNKIYTFSIVEFIIVSLTACSNIVRTTLYNEVMEQKAATISEETPILCCIDRKSPITLVLTKSMNTSSVIFSGTIFEDSASIKWSKTVVDDDTVTFTPKTTWKEDTNILDGDKASLYLKGKSKEGYDSRDIKWKPVILDEIVYLDASHQNNLNNSNYIVTGYGSSKSPFSELTEAIEVYNILYAQKGIGEIHVKKGTYNLNYENGKDIIITSTLNIKGGYDDNNWNLQDPEKNETIIQGNPILTEAELGTFNVDVNAKLSLDGVTVLSVFKKQKKYSLGIRGVADSSIELKNCEIITIEGDLSEESCGIYTEGNLIIDNCKFLIKIENNGNENSQTASINTIGSQIVDIRNSIIDISKSKAKTQFGICIYQKSATYTNTANIINCVLLSGKPTCENFYSDLINLLNAKIDNICSNTFGFNCNDTTWNSSITEFAQHGIVDYYDTKIKNCSGNIFYNPENSNSSSTNIGAIGVKELENLEKCSDNCFIATKAILYDYDENHKPKYSLSEDDVINSNKGFFISNSADATLENWNSTTPLKPTNLSDTRILNSNLTEVLINKDILNNARTAPYTLGAYEVD